MVHDLGVKLSQLYQLGGVDVHGKPYTVWLDIQCVCVTVLTWCLYYLAKYPDIQQRVVEELDGAMGEESDVHIEVYGKLRLEFTGSVCEGS